MLCDILANGERWRDGAVRDAENERRAGPFTNINADAPERRRRMKE